MAKESSEPFSWELLKTLKGLLEMTNMIRVNGIDKADWVFHIDSVSKLSVKECVRHLQLMNGLVMMKIND